MLRSSSVHKNLGQEIVVTTTDKIRLCLRDHRDALTARTAWVAPAGVLITLVATLLTADFKTSLLGLPPDAWQGLFAAATAGSAVWLGRAVYLAVALRPSSDIEAIVQGLKAGLPVDSSESTTDA